MTQSHGRVSHAFNERNKREGVSLTSYLQDKALSTATAAKALRLDTAVTQTLRGFSSLTTEIKML